MAKRKTKGSIAPPDSACAASPPRRRRRPAHWHAVRHHRRRRRPGRAVRAPVRERVFSITRLRRSWPTCRPLPPPRLQRRFRHGLRAGRGPLSCFAGFGPRRCGPWPLAFAGLAGGSAGGGDRRSSSAPRRRAKFGCTTLPPSVSMVALTSSSSRLMASDLRGLVDHRLEEGVEVPGVEQRGAEAATRPGTLRWPTILTPLAVVTTSRHRALDIAAALDREVDDHRARLHRGDHRRRDQLRRRPAGDQRRGDDDVLLGDVLGGQRGLLGLVFLRHFLGVAAGGLGRLELLVLDGEELRAERLDLFLGGRTHVGGGHHRAEAARGGDRLQAGDADAHDEHLGGGHGAGGRHHHRQRAVILRLPRRSPPGSRRGWPGRTARPSPGRG